MDPKNGEISRAMRNRGIEIYLLGEEEGGSYSNHDVMTMLHSMGIVGKEPCETLMSIHDVMKQNRNGPEKLTVLDLMNCAHLVSQQLQRGCHAKSAILNSCLDVYVKTQKNFASKQVI
ncbi:unnamed protein product [Owenia fusiformis]|uniref:Uncharacterized protein n=1 Tax=Owenia fusiformis TaxID=6347 RepID=A0A8S4Q105_OWEFU|nr:unnamed protein product [Owenia fusiformis]